MTAAASLTDLVAGSGARRVAFLGLAKNVGKTTALLSVLSELARRGVRAGTTSAGRDGEEFDAITGEPKPRFRIAAGQLVASAASTFEAASFATRELATLPFATRFGPIQIRRAEGDGELEVIGPSTTSQLAATAAALEEAGAERLLIDGAVGRRAFAGARVSDGVVLSVGMAVARTLEAVASAARAAAELVRLGSPGEGAPIRAHAGALTDDALHAAPPHPGEALVVEDFTCVFLSPAARRALEESGVILAVRRPARLIAATSNPTAPARPPLPARRVFETIRSALDSTPVFDLVADLQS
ncbi:MAG TPA: hypothetical protein VH854_17485 [Thermoanaerobaculia bacterium]|jgi:hypothetical protein|nr:hypothetical protein [Thermoanaerobaculia bacterium]